MRTVFKLDLHVYQILNLFHYVPELFLSYRTVISIGEIQTREQYASDLTFVSCSQLSITIIIYLCDTANRLMKLRVY